MKCWVGLGSGHEVASFWLDQVGGTGGAQGKIVRDGGKAVRTPGKSIPDGEEAVPDTGEAVPDTGGPVPDMPNNGPKQQHQKDQHHD